MRSSLCSFIAPSTSASSWSKISVSCEPSGYSRIRTGAPPFSVRRTPMNAGGEAPYVREPQHYSPYQLARVPPVIGFLTGGVRVSQPARGSRGGAGDGDRTRDRGSRGFFPTLAPLAPFRYENILGQQLPVILLAPAAPSAHQMMEAAGTIIGHNSFRIPERWRSSWQRPISRRRKDSCCKRCSGSWSRRACLPPQSWRSPMRSRTDRSTTPSSLRKSVPTGAPYSA